MSKFDEPLTFKSGVTVTNRLFQAPLTNVQSMHDGQVTLDEMAFYRARAKGLGAVIVSASNVTELGKGWNGELSIADDKYIPNLKKLAETIHDAGAKAFIQIFHAGRLTHEDTIHTQPIAPSVVLAHRPGSELPRAMTENEIETTIAAFGAATRRAIEAGFDGVELHGANGYLVQEFFSQHANRRTDAWGGERAQRFRFLNEVLQSVFAARSKYADRPFVIGYRFSPEEFGHGGIALQDTLWLLDQLQQFDLDYVHMSLDDFQKVSHNPNFREHSILKYIHDHIDGRFPLIGVGGVRTRADVLGVLENAEIVGIGQQLIMQPDWPVLLEEGRDEQFDLRPLTVAVENAPITRTFYGYLIKRFIRLKKLPKPEK